MSIEAMRQALEALKTASGSTRVEQERALYEAAIKRLRNAIDELETMQTQEPDMRHPKVQAIIGARARLQIELRLVEQLVEDPDFETTASDMEYWGPLHDRLKARLGPRQWQGLTKDEVDKWELPDSPTVLEFAKFIEAKLKEKNG